MNRLIEIRHNEERQFLRALRSHDEELASAGRVFVETLHAAATLKDLGRCVTVFGSARFPPGHPYYELAREVGRLLAEEAARCLPLIRRESSHWDGEATAWP